MACIPLGVVRNVMEKNNFIDTPLEKNYNNDPRKNPKKSKA